MGRSHFHCGRGPLQPPCREERSELVSGVYKVEEEFPQLAAILATNANTGEARGQSFARYSARGSARAEDSPIVRDIPRVVMNSLVCLRYHRTNRWPVHKGRSVDSGTRSFSLNISFSRGVLHSHGGSVEMGISYQLTVYTLHDIVRIPRRFDSC